MMGAGWVVYALVTGSLACVACWAAEHIVRARRLPTRWIWALGLGVMLLLGARALASAHEIADAVTFRAPVAVTSVATANAGAPSEIARVAMVVRESMSVAMLAIARAMPRWMGRGVAAAWMLASLFVLLAIVVVHARIARIRRGWPAAELHGHQVRIAPSVGPAVLGVAQPFIVVPRWLLSRSEAEQKLVLSHEAEHLRAGDHLLLAGAWLAAALVPWHPAVWWMLSRLRLAIELDCDARVLRRGVAAREYGTLLIDLAGQCSGFAVGATALADESSHLERRLLAMKPIATRFTRLRAAALVAAGSLAVLAACEAKVPTAAEINSMDVASAERTATHAKMLGESHLATTTFYVDGRKTDPVAAHRITANQIATVSVERGSGDSAVIRITTNGQAPEAAASAEKGPGALERMHEALHGGVKATGMMKVRTPEPATGMMAGMIFINGVRADASAFSRLSPEDIARVDIIKGPDAVKLYNDPAAANGVIRVVTKK